MKHEIPLILKTGGGAIVNTSSGAGVIGIKGSPAYTAAKHGVIGLTRAAALDYAAQNIRVNAVCPGYIITPMMDRFTGGTSEGRARVISEEPIGRMGRPEEIANAVVWLCSEAAGFVVGSVMVIDGGQTIQEEVRKRVTMMDIKRVGSQPSAKGPANWFTGTVRVDPLFQAP